MFFLILSKLVTLLEFSSFFLELDKQIMQRVLFFLTFRSNREIFFVVHFFFVKGVVGGMKGILLILFVFWEKTPSLFIVFQTYNWCSESYRIGLAFRAVFLDLDFFLFRRFFSQSDLFLFAVFCFLYFFFREQRWWWGGVFGICSTKWRGWVTTK